MTPELVLIAAVARNGVIGRGNELLWHLPEDMRFFKAATRGHAVIMGRKTWQSLPPRFRPLPERRNIVVTRNGAFDAPGAELAASLPAAVALVG
ncbi:MAG TPA: dihydrofolate reductase, partial [Rubrivivax sp.]|nr:dihydrofolate reductase [Rubrivivax sp.]